MKILVYTDVHIKHRSTMSSQIDQKYGMSMRLDSIVNSYNWMYDLAVANNCEVIINGGDTLDKPTIVPQENKCIELSYKSKPEIPEYILVGNHDRYSSSYHGLDILNNYDKVEIVDSPKILSLSDKVNLILYPYTREVDNDMINKLSSESEGKTSIMFSHIDMIGTSFNGIISTSGYDPKLLSTKFNLVLNGHIHTPGNYTSNVMNIGSMMSSGLGDNYTEGYPGIMIIDITEGNISYTRYPNPYTPLYRTVQVDSSVSELIPKLQSYDNERNTYLLRVITNESLASSVREYLSSNSYSKLLDSKVVVKLKSSEGSVSSEGDSIISHTSSKTPVEVLYDYINTLGPKKLPVEKATIKKFIDTNLKLSS